jgi:hypothetical protein
MFIAALFTIAKLWKQPRCPTTDEWIKKMFAFLMITILTGVRWNVKSGFDLHLPIFFHWVIKFWGV